MEKAKAIDKIRKCMRLARSSNPHEAAAALRQAQGLMREFGVDDADLLAAAASEARSRSRARRDPIDWEVALANMTASCFGCDIVFVAGWRRGEYAFIGCGARAEIAAYAFQVLLRQAERARATYITRFLNRCRPASKTRRADEFCRYWTVAVKKKVMALVPDAGETESVAAFLAKHYPTTVTDRGRARRAGDLSDRLFDFRAGESAQPHHGVDGAGTPLLSVAGQ